MEVGIILGKDAYEIQRLLDYKIGTRSELFAVLTELGWVVSCPMKGKKSQNVCHFAFTEDVKVAENIQSWWDKETYASKINVLSQSKKEQQAQKFLESTTKFTGGGTKWACSGMNQNPIFRTITAQPLVSSTHWNEDSNETQS